MEENFKSKLGFTMFILVILFLIKTSRYYTAQDFDIEVLKSPVDANNNGIDDYTDIMLGARLDAQNHPHYDARYWSGGYPPDNIGVCADLVWRAFKNAGYDLKTMIDYDIKNNPDVYNIAKIDPNIDFRRVRNLYHFFTRYAENLTLNIEEIEAWQPGDIVIFGENHNHIGIISDKRNQKGIPYLIHNSGQLFREEDVLEIKAQKNKITGHFRFNAQNIANLFYWQD